MSPAISEKRGLALANESVVLHQFLDASLAFDKTLHPIMARIAYQSGIEDDKWLYFSEMHKNAKKVVGWKGATSDLFEEKQVTRQGSRAASDEYKSYNTPMLDSLESLSDNDWGYRTRDTIAGHATTVVAVADDTAPSTHDVIPRRALSHMQVLLYSVEDNAKQLHIEFGLEKCQLLITAKPGKLKKTMAILEDEPDVLTLYGQPVSTIKNGEYYVHLGVVQAPTSQSKLAVDYRLSKGMEMVYLHQGSTKSALSGVNPMSNRNIIKSYDLPTFIYGLDTIPVNMTDLDRLETKFRNVLRNMQSLPANVATPAIYLSMGQLPAVAERDIEILGLLGQVSQCPRDLQAVTDIVEDSLEKYDLEFCGWSGLARRTSILY